MDILRDLLETSESKNELASDGGVDKSDIGEDWEVDVHRGENENSVRLSEGKIHLYPQSMDPEVITKFHMLTREVKEREGVVKRMDIEEEVSELKHLDKSDIDSIVEFFDGPIQRRYLELLRSSLYLQRSAANPDISLKQDIDEYKADLKEDYGPVAYYMNHLVSSGYFNENSFFQEMYFGLMERDGDTDSQYQREFELILERELLALFVNSKDSSRKVKLGMKEKLNGYYMYSPYADFIDVRGLGAECEEIIEEAVELFKEEYENAIITELEESDEKAVRLLPRSINTSLSSFIMPLW